MIIVTGAGEHFGAGHDIGTPAMRSELGEHLARLLGNGPGQIDGSRRVLADARPMAQHRQADNRDGAGLLHHGLVDARLRACDLAVAAERTRSLADRSVRWGGAHHEYPTHFWELGIKKAKEYLWTGDFVTAEEGAAAGHGQSRGARG